MITKERAIKLVQRVADAAAKHYGAVNGMTNQHTNRASDREWQAAKEILLELTDSPVTEKEYWDLL